MYRPIEIRVVLNGFVVTVGCQTVVYQDADDLLEELGAYFRDPDAAEKRYSECLHARHTLNDGPRAVPTMTNERQWAQEGQPASAANLYPPQTARP